MKGLEHCSQPWLTGALLLYGTGYFPPWGDPQTRRGPTPRVYIDKAVEQTHAAETSSLRFSAIIGPRSTMFETVVIYCAGMALQCLLRRNREDEE